MPAASEWREVEWEADAPPPERRRTRWGARIMAGAALLVLAALATLGWRLLLSEEPPAPAAAVVESVPIRDAIPLAAPPRAPEPRPAPAPQTTRVLTIQADAVTLTVDRPAKPAAIAPPAPSHPPEPGRRITHVVARGDTLSHIAHRYLGDGARYPELARRSRISDPDLIHPGDIVTIVDQGPPRR
jgi:nucleoid-associated protein YgaU